MLHRFGKAFYYLSLLAFMFFLLYFYSAMPDLVGLSVNESGGVDRSWDKSSFFYAMIAAFLFFNATSLFTPKSLETKSNRKMHKVFPIGDPYRDYILAWFYSFAALINLSLGLLVFYVHAINNQEEIAANSFSFWFYLMPSLLLIWVIGLFVLLVKKFKAVQIS